MTGRPRAGDDERWEVARANGALGRTLDGATWEFLVARIGHPDVRWDGEAGEVVFAAYIPLVALVREVLAEVDAGRIDPAPCVHCRRMYDRNREDAIFGDPAQLDRLVCDACSRSLSARDFYERYLKT